MTDSHEDAQATGSALNQAAARVLVLGAHPDDPEYHAGGLIAEHAAAGSMVKLVSVTNGAAGHHQLQPNELANTRRREAAAAGAVVGCEYETWDFPDGRLQPTIEVRERIISEIRQFKPDLILTHRTNDYHPDHRAVGQAVQDASYLVTVPLVVPEVQVLDRDPVVAYMVDLFTKPCPMQPDVVLDITSHIDTIVNMLACQSSQVFEWLPYNQGIIADVPAANPERMHWLKSWYQRQINQRADRFRNAINTSYGKDGSEIQFIEIYEISEYASDLAEADRRRLFPNCKH